MLDSLTPALENRFPQAMDGTFLPYGTAARVIDIYDPIAEHEIPFRRIRDEVPPRFCDSAR